MTEEQRWASMHVRDRDGRVTSAGRALLVLLAALPGLGRLDRAADRIPALISVADTAYNLVARNRGWLGRLVPDRAPVSRWRG